MVQSFERRKMQKSGFLHFHRRIERTHGVINDFQRMLGFSFIAFHHQVYSERHSVSRAGSAQDQLLYWGRCLSLDYHGGPSDSAPHVPMYHYAALR
jgi:hypothetical protein